MKSTITTKDFTANDIERVAKEFCSECVEPIMAVINNKPHFLFLKTQRLYVF